jgi:hypothetical protein
MDESLSKLVMHQWDTVLECFITALHIFFNFLTVKMCWNAPISFTTFFLGTMLNFICYKAIKESNVWPILFYWQYALIMQLWEGIAWLQLQNNESIKIVSWVAFIFNITQPIILGLVTQFGLRSKSRRWIVANSLYLVVLLSESVWNFEDISPPEGCRHLDLKYWNATTTTIYVFTSLWSFSDIPDKFWAVFNSIIFVVSLLVATMISPCGVGSLFCWLIVFSGVYLYIAHTIKSKVSCLIQSTGVVVSMP